MSQFLAPCLKYILLDTGPDLRRLGVRIPGKLIPASVLFAKRLFLHVQLSQRLADGCLGWLIRPVFVLQFPSARPEFSFTA